MTWRPSPHPFVMPPSPDPMVTAPPLSFAPSNNPGGSYLERLASSFANHPLEVAPAQLQPSPLAAFLTNFGASTLNRMGDRYQNSDKSPANRIMLSKLNLERGKMDAEQKKADDAARIAAAKEAAQTLRQHQQDLRQQAKDDAEALKKKEADPSTPEYQAAIQRKAQTQADESSATIAALTKAGLPIPASLRSNTGQVTEAMATAYGLPMSMVGTPMASLPDKYKNSVPVKEQNAPGTMDYPAEAKRTFSSKQYFNMDDTAYSTKEHPAIREAIFKYNATHPDDPIGIIGKGGQEVIDNVNTARQNIQSIGDFLQDGKGNPLLPLDAITRAEQAPGIKLSQMLQTDEKRAAYGAWRNAAIQMMRAAAGAKGLRINQAEIAAAMANDIPLLTDTWGVAKQKMDALNKQFDAWENSYLTRDMSQFNKSLHKPSAANGPAAPTAADSDYVRSLGIKK